MKIVKAKLILHSKLERCILNSYHMNVHIYIFTLFWFTLKLQLAVEFLVYKFKLRWKNTFLLYIKYCLLIMNFI